MAVDNSLMPLVQDESTHKFHAKKKQCSNSEQSEYNKQGNEQLNLNTGKLYLSSNFGIAGFH